MEPLNMAQQFPFTNGTQTPSPWFTIANQFVPRNLHDVIKWARYITLQSPTTSEVIRKLSTYPITDFNYSTEKESVKEKYKEVVKTFKLKQALQNIGFEYFTIGNCFISIYFPIHRSLVCPSCKATYNAKKAEFVKFKQYKFVGTCPHCKADVEFEKVDTKSFDIKAMNVVRWNPENIGVNHNPITGESEYYYKIPNAIKLKIQRGDRLFIDSIPWEFVEAVQNNQDFKFGPDSIFHLQNVTTGGSVDGVSVPPLLSMFSLVFYQATLRKANEAIATEFLNPLRVVFPQPNTTNQDPAVTFSSRNFVGMMEKNLMLQKTDKNRVMIAPMAVGYQTIGGEGRNLLVTQEIAQAEETILLALGVSKELLSGTTNWTSSSVGLRMMENLLFSYISRLQEAIDWMMDSVAAYLNIEKTSVTLQPFKLLDDDNFKNLLFQLSQPTPDGQPGPASKTTLFEALGLDFFDELEKLKQEAINTAKTKIDTQYEVEQAQFMAAKKVGENMRENEEFKVLLQKAQGIAAQLTQTDQQTRMDLLNELKTQDYSMWLMASQLLNSMGEQQTDLPIDQEQDEENGPNSKPKSNKPKKDEE